MKRAIPMAAWVAVGSALGATARWGVGQWFDTTSVTSFPWSTLGINAVGSIAIGAYAASTGVAGRWSVSAAQRHFVMSGICGGFTTFSLFTAEVLASAARGDYRLAGSIILVSVPAWLLGVWLGYAAGESGNRLSR
jgi:CrcB protein